MEPASPGPAGAAGIPDGAKPAAGATTLRTGRVGPTFERLVALTRAVADADPVTIEKTAQQIGDSRRYLAPVAWASGTIVLLIRGIKLLVLNWRLLIIQLVPAVWIWVTMWDLRQHALRGAPFRDLTPGGTVLLVLITVGFSIGAMWCNTVFAFAVQAPPPPRIRPAVSETRRHLGRIVVVGALLGAALAFAAFVVPRISSTWLYALTLGGVLCLMLVSFVAVPAGIIGRRRQKLPPRQAIGRTAAGWALSGVAMAPGFILDRIGIILISTSELYILGLVLLSIGTALYAAGMSSVKAVKLTIKLGDPE